MARHMPTVVSSLLSVVVNAQADGLDMRWSSGLIAG